MPPRPWRARRAPEPPTHGHPQLRRRIEALEQDRDRLAERLAEAEAGLQEQRELSLRIAELTDLVTTLVAAAARGEDEFRRVLDRVAPTDR